MHSEQKFRDKRTNDTEIDVEGSQASYEIGQNGEDERVNAGLRRARPAA